MRRPAFLGRGPSVLVALALVVASGSPVAAAPPDAATVARAKKHFEQGEAEYRVANFKGALVSYKAALKLVKRSSIIFNIAQCYRQLEDPRSALFFYKLYLAEWTRQHPGQGPPNLTEVGEHITKLTISVETRKEKARFDELRREMKELLGHRTMPFGPPQAKPTFLRVAGLRGVRGAEVYVDGVLRATTPLAGPIDVTPGSHELRVASAGMLPWMRTITISAERTTEVFVSLRAKPQKSTLWLVSTISSAALAAGAEALAIVFFAQANKHFSGTPAFDDAKRMVVVGHVGAAVLGAWAVTSLVFYLRSGALPAGERAQASVAPLPGGFAALARFAF